MLGYEQASKINDTRAKSEFIHTTNGTGNSLDFCLVADLSHNVVEHKDALHIVLSSDKGYTSAIGFLKGLGYRVIRVESLDNILDVALRFEYDFVEHSYPLDGLRLLEKDSCSNSFLADVSCIASTKTHIRYLDSDDLIKSTVNLRKVLTDKFFKKYAICIRPDYSLDNSIASIINRGTINIENIIDTLTNTRNLRVLKTSERRKELAQLIRENKRDLKEVKE